MKPIQIKINVNSVSLLAGTVVIGTALLLSSWQGTWTTKQGNLTAEQVEILSHMRAAPEAHAPGWGGRRHLRLQRRPVRRLRADRRAYPFRTVFDGHAATSDGDRMIVRTGSYPETGTFPGKLMVYAQGGGVTVGF